MINQTPSTILNGKTPYEALYGHSPSYEHLRVFGLYGTHITKGQKGINLLVEVGDVFLLDTHMGKRDGGCTIWRPEIFLSQGM